jgi:hypothetical protein
VLTLVFLLAVAFEGLFGRFRDDLMVDKAKPEKDSRGLNGSLAVLISL